MGIAIGSVYSLIALGFQITYSVSNTMNFSQGASVMLGAVVCYSLNITYGWHIAIAGILYGIGESLAAGYLGGSYREIIGFALVILALTLRPNGLFGKNQINKL